MTNIRNWINLVENIDKEREFYINQANEFRAERSKWWPISKELMASYRDDDKSSHKLLDNSLVWWKNGVWHRDGDKPAEIYADGSLAWYKNGLRHRDGDKPARIWADGRLEWRKNDKRHRDGDKPAYIGADGALLWYKNGKHHRLLGPAQIYSHNKFVWWFRGEQIRVRSQEEYEEWIHKNHPFDNEIKQLYY